MKTTTKAMREEARELLDQLVDHTEDMNEKSKRFVEDLYDKFEQYDDRTFVSEAQLEWLRDLADEHQ